MTDDQTIPVEEDHGAIRIVSALTKLDQPTSLDAYAYIARMTTTKEGQITFQGNTIDILPCFDGDKLAGWDIGDSRGRISRTETCVCGALIHKGHIIANDRLIFMIGDTCFGHMEGKHPRSERGKARRMMQRSYCAEDTCTSCGRHNIFRHCCNHAEPGDVVLYCTHCRAITKGDPDKAICDRCCRQQGKCAVCARIFLFFPRLEVRSIRGLTATVRDKCDDHMPHHKCASADCTAQLTHTIHLLEDHCIEHAARRACSACKRDFSPRDSGSYTLCSLCCTRQCTKCGVRYTLERSHKATTTLCELCEYSRQHPRCRECQAEMSIGSEPLCARCAAGPRCKLCAKAIRQIETYTVHLARERPLTALAPTMHSRCFDRLISRERLQWRANTPCGFVVNSDGEFVPRYHQCPKCKKDAGAYFVYAPPCETCL